MNLPKIHSISKKICVALLGGFLLIFLLFHASANLLVLRHDDGAWYSAFCHFMGSNYIVKVGRYLKLSISSGVGSMSRKSIRESGMII